MDADIRIATPADVQAVAAILGEASARADSLGADVLWQFDEVSPERLAGDIARGEFFIAWCGHEAAGTVKFQLEDPEFWPDDPGDHAAYIHRLGVLRKYAGGQVSGALMSWAVDHARAAGRRALRLDCDAHRRSLRAVYERFGFRHHSNRQVGPYFVSRYEYPLAGQMLSFEDKL